MIRAVPFYLIVARFKSQSALAVATSGAHAALEKIAEFREDRAVSVIAYDREFREITPDELGAIATDLGEELA